MFTRIEIEGCDKTGKDTLVPYLDYLSNRTIPISTRGLLSTMYRHNLSDEKINKMIEDNKNTLIILLHSFAEDLEIRFKMCDEPPININEDIDTFAKYAGYVCSGGITVVMYNTSKMTPYMIAKDIMKIIKEEENK